MKLRIVNIGIVVAVVSAFAANNTAAQEARSKRNFEAEIQAALESAEECRRVRTSRHSGADVSLAAERR